MGTIMPPAFYAAVVILNPEHTKVLLGQRRKMQSWSKELTWTGCGGKGRSQETPAESAIRETLEEAGIGLTPRDLKQVFMQSAYDYKPIYVFIATLPESTQVKPTSEVAQWQWFDINQLPQTLERSPRLSIERVAEGLRRKGMRIKAMEHMGHPGYKRTTAALQTVLATNSTVQLFQNDQFEINLNVRDEEISMDVMNHHEEGKSESFKIADYDRSKAPKILKVATQYKQAIMQDFHRLFNSIKEIIES